MGEQFWNFEFKKKNELRSSLMLLVKSIPLPLNLMSNFNNYGSKFI